MMRESCRVDTVKDIEKHQAYPNAALDSSGSLIVGAAVGPGDWNSRLPLLVKAGVDFIVMDLLTEPPKML